MHLPDGRLLVESTGGERFKILDLVAAAPRLERLAKTGTGPKLVRLTGDLQDFARRAEAWTQREGAHALWVAWLRAAYR